MREIVISVLLLIISTIVNAIELKGGYGIFLMKDIRDMVEDSGTNNLGGLDIALDFSLIEITGKINLGIGIGNLFTVIKTSRIETENYTSEVKEIPWALDMLIKGNYTIKEYDNYTKLVCSIGIGPAYVRLGRETMSKSGSDTGSLMNYYDGFAPVVESGIELIHKIGEETSVLVEIGLRYLRSSKLRDSSGESPKKTDGGELQVDFTGIYARIGLNL